MAFDLHIGDKAARRLRQRADRHRRASSEGQRRKGVAHVDRRPVAGRAFHQHRRQRQQHQAQDRGAGPGQTWWRWMVAIAGLRARRGGLEAAQQHHAGQQHQRHHHQQMPLRRPVRLRQRRAYSACREEAQTPKGMGAVHDALAESVLDPVGFEVDDQFGRADHQADRHQPQVQRQRPRCPGRQRHQQRQQRQQDLHRPPNAQALNRRAGKAQADQRARGQSDQRQAQRALARVHLPLHVGQPWKQAAQTEGVDKEQRKNPALSRGGVGGRVGHGKRGVCDGGGP